LWFFELHSPEFQKCDLVILNYQAQVTLEVPTSNCSCEDGFENTNPLDLTVTGKCIVFMMMHLGQARIITSKHSNMSHMFFM